MKIGELAQKIQISRVHAWRLAKAGVVPRTKKTKGGHFYFVQCRALTRWINFMIGGAFRKKELARAYAKNYGSENFKDRRERRRTFKEYRMGSWCPSLLPKWFQSAFRLSTFRLPISSPLLACNQASNDLFSLRLSSLERLWGLRSNDVFSVLWWDPNHQICPSPKKHT
jgi:predicted DNA-binding transcriptional regulator AlpA